MQAPTTAAARRALRRCRAPCRSTAAWWSRARSRVFSILPTTLPVHTEPVIFVDGIEIPEVNPDPDLDGVGAGAALTTPYIVAAQDSPGVAPSGWLLDPRDASAGPLTATDVE